MIKSARFFDTQKYDFAQNYQNNAEEWLN